MAAMSPVARPRSRPAPAAPASAIANAAGPTSGSTPGPTATSDHGGDSLESRFLEGLIGYTTRRVSMAVGNIFYERMAPYGLKQAEFSVLVLLDENPGATSRQLCAALDILPPNFVRLIGALDRRGLIERRPHPQDGRAVGLYLSDAGRGLVAETCAVVSELETGIVAGLSEQEFATLQALLRRLHLGNPANVAAPAQAERPATQPPPAERPPGEAAPATTRRKAAATPAASAKPTTAKPRRAR